MIKILLILLIALPAYSQFGNAVKLRGKAIASPLTCTDTQALVWNATDARFECATQAGAGTGAPDDATYIVQTGNGTLSGEQALSSLASGLVYVTTTTGVLGSRVLTGTANQITVTNGDGISGAPTISLPSGVTLTAPVLGTPASGTLTNATGLPISTGVSGLGTGVAAFLATPSSANLITAVTNETGTGALVFATSPALVTPDLGTPSAGVLTNATGLPVSTGVSGLGTGVGTFLGTPSSANLASAVTGETGSGALVFGTSPTLSGLTLSDIASGTQCLHVNSSGAVSGTGSDCGAGGGGSGTVTVVSAGSLTSTALVTGGGSQALQTAAATATMDSSGNISTPGSITSGAGGSVAGALQLGQGTATTPAANSIVLQAPTSVTTAYSMAFPAAAGTGFLLNTDTSNAGALTFVASTGSGNVVRATSATLVTPALGTPTALVLTNATGLVEAGLTLADNTTANVTTSAHGLAPKLDNNASHFLNGQGGWTTPAGGGSGCVPGGSNNQILTDDGSGACASEAAAQISGGVFDLGTAGSVVGTLRLRNGTSGQVDIIPVTGALGTVAWNLPAVNDTFVGLAAAQTLTNKTLTSPTLVTPALGTPASGTLTNATGLPVAGLSNLGSNVGTFLVTANRANFIAAVTDLAASTTQTGIAEAAIAAEVDTGTDAARYVSPDALAGSAAFGTKIVEIEAFPDATTITTGDNKAKFAVPLQMNGMKLIAVYGYVSTVSSSGAITVDIARCALAATGNECSGTVADVLSTNLTIDANENKSATAATPAVIDTANDDADTDVVFRIDVDGAGTGAAGLRLTLVFQLP